MIWGNGSGYQFLIEIFSIAAELQKNEILYLPVSYQGSEEFTEIFRGFEYNYNIICTNYCETQILQREIENILKIKVWTEEVIVRDPKINTEFIDRWKTDRRLTVKIHKKNMYISTNRDGFRSLSCGAYNMAKYGDKYTVYDSPHRHFDSDENTSSSEGVTLYYWSDK